MFRILVVDDDRTLRSYVSALLRRAGYDTDEACNGLQALEKVKDQPPDVILLDLMMPVMDGIETCRRLKGNPDTRNIPVLIVTVIESGPQKQSALALGCNDFMNKPIRKQELLYKLKWWTKRITELPPDVLEESASAKS